jgi:hypothetical protein
VREAYARWADIGRSRVTGVEALDLWARTNLCAAPTINGNTYTDFNAIPIHYSRYNCPTCVPYSQTRINCFIYLCRRLRRRLRQAGRKMMKSTSYVLQDYFDFVAECQVNSFF